MSGHHVLTDHKGHHAVIESETALRCWTCQKAQEREVVRLLLPRPGVGVPTPTPPPFSEVVQGRGVPPDSVPEWVELKKRMGRKP